MEQLYCKLNKHETLHYITCLQQHTFAYSYPAVNAMYFISRICWNLSFHSQGIVRIGQKTNKSQLPQKKSLLGLSDLFHAKHLKFDKPTRQPLDILNKTCPRSGQCYPLRNKQSKHSSLMLWGCGGVGGKVYHSEIPQQKQLKNEESQ